MAKDWDYAQMSHAASLAGGPEKWLELIKSEEFTKGVAKGTSEMKGKMAPWLVVAAGIGVGGTLLIQKANEWARNRKEEKEQSAKRAAEAEAMLISHLKNESEIPEQEEVIDPIEE